MKVPILAVAALLLGASQFAAATGVGAQRTGPGDNFSPANDEEIYSASVPVR